MKHLIFAHLCEIVYFQKVKQCNYRINVSKQEAWWGNYQVFVIDETVSLRRQRTASASISTMSYAQLSSCSTSVSSELNASLDGLQKVLLKLEGGVEPQKICNQGNLNWNRMFNLLCNLSYLFLCPIVGHSLYHSILMLKMKQATKWNWTTVKVLFRHINDEKWIYVHGSL